MNANASGTATSTSKYYSLGGLDDNGALRYLLTDHQGSTITVLNSSGGAVSHQRYYAFGGIRPDLGGTNNQTDFGYTGQRNMSSIGSMDYKARFYDPVLGRFLQPDSMVPGAGNPQTLNRYAYVLNNPINHNDPTGHCVDGLTTLLCAAIAGALIGAAIAYGSQVIENVSAKGLSVDAFTKVDVGKIGVAAAAGAVAGTVGVAVGLAAAAVAGTGLAATVVGGVVAGVTSGQASRAITNVAEGEEWNQGLLNPTDMAIDGTIGGLTAGAGYGIGKILSSTPSGNPLAGIKNRYTPKVLEQATWDDYHGFPELVDTYTDDAIISQLIGKDGQPYTKIQIPGGYKNTEGFFEYIIDEAGNCNHRCFTPLSQIKDN